MKRFGVALAGFIYLSSPCYLLAQQVPVADRSGTFVGELAEFHLKPGPGFSKVAVGPDPNNSGQIMRALNAVMLSDAPVNNKGFVSGSIKVKSVDHELYGRKAVLRIEYADGSFHGGYARVEILDGYVQCIGYGNLADCVKPGNAIPTYRYSDEQVRQMAEDKRQYQQGMSDSNCLKVYDTEFRYEDKSNVPDDCVNCRPRIVTDTTWHVKNICKFSIKVGISPNMFRKQGWIDIPSGAVVDNITMQDVNYAKRQ